MSYNIVTGKYPDMFQSLVGIIVKVPLQMFLMTNFLNQLSAILYFYHVCDI
jgi:hypothetical protein